MDRSLGVGSAGRRYTRRGAIALAGSLGATGLAIDPADAAGTSNLFVVVDAAGGGDYTDLEQAVRETSADSTIFVKRGLYVIQTGNMGPAPGVRIVGEGYGTHIRSRDGLNTNVFLIRNDNVMFERIRIDGNGMNQKFAFGCLFDFQPSVGGTVINCWAHEAGSYNIVAYPGCSQVVFAGNHSWGARQEGIELSGSSHSVVVGNTCWDNLNGINVWSNRDTAGWNAVVGNVCNSNTDYGIVLQDGAHDCSVAGNTCHANGKSGILVGAGGGSVPRASYGITVSGNVVSDNASSGIQLNRVRECTVTRNVVRANWPHGILLRMAEACSVYGNIARRNKGAGIWVEATTAEPVEAASVIGNVCFDNGQDVSQIGAGGRSGITVSGPVAHAVVQGNRCFDAQAAPTQSAGVQAQGSPPPGLLAGPNVLDGNGSAGLAVPAAPSSIHTVPFRRVRATVGKTETLVPHGLPYPPLAIELTTLSSGRVWRTRSPDATGVYLRADGPGREVELLVG